MFHADTYQHIQDEIERLAPQRDVTLVGVTKYATLPDMESAYKAGLRHFGENRLDVALPKIEHFSKQGIHDIQWHFIGHLQRKKVPKLASHFTAIHSVNTVELAEKLHQTAQKLILKRAVFLQVNIANETQKSGFTAEQLDDVLPHIQQQCPTLLIEGLMAMLPKGCSAEQAAHWYGKCHSLNRQYGFQKLSTGMTQDYSIALKHGATHIRIGRALFSSEESE